MTNRGETLRQARQFSAACAFMIDDLGAEVGGSVKVPFSALDRLMPTALVETSPGNFQAWYFFKEPLRSEGTFNKLISEFIKVKCEGTDPGMAGVTRVGRTPDSTNGKPSNKNWKVRLAEWHPELRYTVSQLATRFGLDMRAIPWDKKPRALVGDHSGRIANFETILQLLKIWGLNKRNKTGLTRQGRVDESEFNHSGWMEIVCPWIGDHGGGADSGSAIQMPMPENSFLGGFQCHHGHCIDRNLGSLMQWVNAQMDEDTIDKTAKLLTKINKEAAK
jgi:hypothetical protein